MCFGFSNKQGEYTSDNTWLSYNKLQVHLTLSEISSASWKQQMENSSQYELQKGSKLKVKSYDS